MEYLTICEEIVYNALLHEHKEMTSEEITTLINVDYHYTWNHTNIKAFLGRLKNKGCVEVHRERFKKYYSVVPYC